MIVNFIDYPKRQGRSFKYSLFMDRVILESGETKHASNYDRSDMRTLKAGNLDKSTYLPKL